MRVRQGNSGAGHRTMHRLLCVGVLVLIDSAVSIEDRHTDSLAAGLPWHKRSGVYGIVQLRCRCSQVQGFSAVHNTIP